MTGQYQQNNINVPRKTQVFNSEGLINVQSLDLDSDFIIVRTDTDSVAVRLPTSDQIPCQQIIIKTTNSGTTGNTVLILAPAGELIDGFASIALTSDEESVILKASGGSDGAGYYWQVVSSSGGTAGVGPQTDLLSTLPGDFSVDNIISFDSWPALLAALALLPTNGALFQPSRIWTGNLADAGWDNSSIGGASIEGVSSVGGQYGRASLDNHEVSISNVRSLKNLDVGYGLIIIAEGARFLAGDSSDDEGYMTIENCRFEAPRNGAPLASAIAMGGVLELHGQNYFDLNSILVDVGATLNVECYDRCVIVGSTFVGGGTVIASILDASANVDIIQPGVTFDLQLGSTAAGAYPYAFGNAGELQFGGQVRFVNGPSEIYAGGANVPVPVGSGAPAISPPFTGSVVGATITRPGYIRGIGVTINNPAVTPGTFDIEIYAGGVLAFTETGFDTTSSGYQYFDTGFARIGPTVPTYGGSLQVVIVPTAGEADVTINVFPRFV